MSQGRTLPQDIEAEEAVNGSLLIDPDAILKVAGNLKAEDFFSETNRWIFQACVALYQRNEAINQVTVAHELLHQNKLEQASGSSYLSHLISVVPTSLHIEYYAQIVSRMAVMRRLISAAEQISAIGYNAGPDIDISLSKAEDFLFQVRTGQDFREFSSIRDLLNKYFDEKGTPVESQDAHEGRILTGFTGIDAILGGLHKSDLIILASRPSLGKTSLALNIARNVAVNQGACVAIFSLEMSKESVVERFLSSESGVDSHYIRLRRFTEKDEAKIMEASGLLSETAIYIDDSPQIQAIDIRSKVKRLRFERNINLVIIDYIQLISGSGRNENRVQELSKITRSLKIMARELDVPVLALSQLSRAVEWRTGQKPQLSDLRESGTIEQDADIVCFIYREDKTISEEEWEKAHILDGKPYPRDMAEIMISKHRNGPLGEVKLHFSNRLVKFENMKGIKNPVPVK
jgi:replicative DNA helicase